MSHHEELPPATIARKTLQRIASLKIVPTPDNYHKIYDEIAGTGNAMHRMNTGAKQLLSEFVTQIPRSTPELVGLSNTLARAIRDNDWEKYKSTLLGNTIAAKTAQSEATQKAEHGTGISWGESIEQLLKQLDTHHRTLTVARKRQGLQQLLMHYGDDSDRLQEKIHALIESWRSTVATEDDTTETAEQEKTDICPPPAGTPAPTIAENRKQEQQDPDLPAQSSYSLPGLLANILEHVAAIPFTDPAFIQETNDLARKVRNVQNKTDMEEFISYYSQYLEKFDFNVEDGAKLQRGLFRLFNKLIESTRKLLTEDDWVQTQIAQLQQTVTWPLNQRSIAQAECQLEAISQRQGTLKHGLNDARETLKKMITDLVSNIEGLSLQTGEFQTSLESYTGQINAASDLQALDRVVAEIINETRRMHSSAQHYRTGFLSARAEVEAAHERINLLESELQQLSEKIHEDHLTGILNRRGLDMAFERESSRALRLQQKLCYALLDIDNFKKLNDTHGHKVGDEAIVFLVNSIKAATRIDDIVARYGGEEFVVLLPDTKLAEAVEILSRVRRNLTKEFFLQKNNRLLITFSAGIAEYRHNETQDSVFKRADEALYRAKRNGKNLILEAQ